MAALTAGLGGEEGRGVLVQVDPTLTRADRLVGQVLGEVGALPDVFTELEINFFLLRRLLGVRTQVRPFALPSRLQAAPACFFLLYGPPSLMMG